MKTTKYLLIAAVSFAAMACVQEENPVNEGTQESGLVQMTFTASADDEDTKVFYDGNTKTTQWKAGDKIMVISSTGTAAEFEATEVTDNGMSATFEGWHEADETYYAVYPASAYKGNNLAEPTNTQTGGRLYVEIPAEQTAVAGSFDPDALVMTATNSGDHLSFKNLCSVIKFNLANPEGVQSVKFTMNGNTNLAGNENVYVDKLTSHTWADAFDGRYSKNMITLNAPAEGFAAEKDYYFTLRPYSQKSEDTEDKKGVKIYVVSEDGVKVRSGASEFAAVQNTIKSLGTIDAEGKITALTPYESYQMGFDLVVAGKSYKTSSLGSATLISENTTISADGIYFIAEGVESVQLTKGPYAKLFIIGNSPTVKSNISFTEQFRYSSKAEIGLKSLTFAQYTTDMFVHNNESEATRFAFDNCHIITPSKDGVMYNGASRTLAEFAMHNCDIMVSKNSDIFIRTNAAYTNIDVQNNIFYSADNDKMDFYLFNYGSGEITNLTLKQNTFANVYNITSGGGQNPYITANSVSNYTLADNLFYLERYNQYGNPTSWILSCTPGSSEINNNMMFKDMSNARLQVYKGGSTTEYTTTKANVVNGKVDLTVPIIVPATTAGATR